MMTKKKMLFVALLLAAAAAQAQYTANYQTNLLSGVA